MNLLAGSTGFLGNRILDELSLCQNETLALSRRKINTLPKNTEQLIIDFKKLSELEIPQIEHVFLSLGFPLFFHNVMGIMNKNLKKNLFLVDFTYQLEIAKKAKDAGTKNISIISAVGANPQSWDRSIDPSIHRSIDQSVDPFGWLSDQSLVTFFMILSSYLGRLRPLRWQSPRFSDLLAAVDGAAGSLRSLASNVLWYPSDF